MLVSVQLMGLGVMLVRVVAALVFVALAGMTGVDAGDRYWTPKAGTAERKAVLDAARLPVEKDLGQPVVFEVRTLRVTPDWAFLNGIPVRGDGKPIDYSKSIYAQDAEEDSFSGEAAVLLAREGSGWRLVTYSIGFGDVVWDGWDEEFGAPEWLWP
jgi:hypothetical protein